jgi:glutathione S-transferase
MPESYIMSRAEKDFEAFSILLGDKPFFFGSKPSSLDAYVYGFLDSMINSGVPIPPIRTLERHRNLIDHLSRFRALLDAKQSE